MRDQKSYMNYKELYSEKKSEPVEDLATEVAVKEDITNELKVLSGTVSGCEVLNLRSEPRNDIDNVVTTFALNDKVKVFENKSTDEYYYVELDKYNSMEHIDVSGYVMKKYITID